MNSKDKKREAIIDGTIRFEDESKEDYLIKDIVKLAEYNFGLSIIPLGNKKEDETYQKTVNRIYKELTGKETEKSTPRKHLYSKGTVRWLLENRLYEYFLKMSQNYEAYQHDVKVAKNNFKRMREQLIRENNIHSDTEMMDKQMEEMKLTIALDYICKHCIDIDEPLLGSDISLLASESESPEEQVYLAWDRLTNNPGAYYTVKK